MDAWQSVLSVVEGRVDPQQFNTWFRQTQFIKFENRALYVRVPSPFVRDWLNDRLDLVLAAAAAAGYGDVDVIYLTERAGDVEVAAGGQRRLDFETIENTLNSRYTFETFVVGSSNQFAHAASLAVAERPSRAYNPLFLYGGVGLGKTHLMHAMGHRIKKDNRDLRLSYVSAEKFTNELIGAIRFDRLTTFRDQYRNTDVLLIDDIQFIAGKERTQEEFFHTFNTLFDNHKQLVISADCPPRKIPTIEERLHSRFEWGLIADVQPPDLETKIAILNKKAEKQGIVLPDNVALYIASNIRSNIRELEGALIRLAAMAAVKGSDITLPMAQDTLEDILGTTLKLITMDMILKVVGDHFGIRGQDLKTKTNAKAISEPRQIAMYLAKELTNASLPQIGRDFGKHHTTVLHAVGKIQDLRRSNKDLDRLIQGLINSLR